MIQVRHLAVHHLHPHRVIHYRAGEVLEIAFGRKLRGFGVHFAPIESHAAWKLRIANSGVGLQTYAQSQRFSLDDYPLRLESAGDETIEVSPHRSGHVLRIIPEHSGILQADTPPAKAYRPPVWAYDFWFSTPSLRLSEAEVRKEMTTAHAHHLHPTVWLFDANWESTEHFLHLNPVRFPSGDSFVEEVRQRGIRPIMWLPPWIPTHTHLWRFFNARDWFVKGADHKTLVFPVNGSLSIQGSYLDFTSKDFVAYFTQEVQLALDRGIAGFMSDFGEVLPDEAVLQCDTPTAEAARSQGLAGHNWYIDEVKRVLHAAVSGRDACIISRAGWTNAYQHTGLWLGDQSSDASRFAGLVSAAWGYYSAVQADYRFVGMDIGGYFGHPVTQDYINWMSLAICMPFAMHHGNIHANPWEEGQEALAYHRWARQKHHQLWQVPEQKPRFITDQRGMRLKKIQVGDHSIDLTTIV